MTTLKLPVPATRLLTGLAPRRSRELERKARVLEWVDVRKIREDPPAEDFLALLEDGDAGGRVGQLDAVGRDLVRRHRESREEDVRPNLEVRTGNGDRP